MSDRLSGRAELRESFAQGGSRETFRFNRALVLIPAAIIAAGVAWDVLKRPSATAVAPPAPSVGVAMPLQRNVVEWDDYVGRFVPSQTVAIRPRVSGAIVALHFHDGDVVQKGQLLFTVDPRPYQAALDEARAGVASARSALALARSDLQRATRLTGDEALSAGEMDSLRAHAQAAEADLAAAEARERARALDVEFTEIRSPITGRVSDRRVDIGNLVTGDSTGNATLLTTVNALDPIYFTFEGSEALRLKEERQRQPGAAAPTAEIRLQGEIGYRWKGTVDFTDNGLDLHSGTIRSRAVLANPDYFLTPGMFGNMRLTAGGPTPVLLVPDVAVQTDQARKLVLTVAPDNTVAPVQVEIGPVVDGLRVIRSGLAPDAHVIVSGIAYAVPGTPVQGHTETVAPAPAAVPAPNVPMSAEATLADR